MNFIVILLLSLSTAVAVISPYTALIMVTGIVVMQQMRIDETTRNMNVYKSLSDRYANFIYKQIKHLRKGENTNGKKNII